MTLAGAGCSVPQVGIWRQRGVVVVVGSQTDAGGAGRANALERPDRESWKLRRTSFAA